MCDTVTIVRPDRVLFAKNSDRDPNEAQRLEWHPTRSHEQGSVVRCTFLEIPQVAHTHAVLLSRPFWMWGAEMGLNEHGVVIGNEAVFTRSRVPRVGLTGMDLVRLALERSTTAEEAVVVLQALLDAWPQGGGMGHENRSFRYHSSFLIADATGAWVLETAGAVRAVEPVTQGARAISNALSIDAMRSHRKAVHTAISAADTRRSRTESLASQATSAGDLFRVLRDHGDTSTPCYRWHNGAMAAPCMHAGGLLAASQTTASLVVELTPSGATAWATGTAAPCTGLFKPVRVDTPIDVGEPTDTPDDSLWWRHERLHRAVMKDPRRRLAYATERDAVEARWLADPPDPVEAFAVGDRLLAEWTEALEGLEERDVRPWYARRYWQRRSHRHV